MEATYFVHHRLCLSTRPSLATYSSPSCHGHQHNHVLNFHNHQSSFHGLTQKSMAAKRNPSSLTIVACTYAAKEDDNNDMNKGRPLKHRPSFRRAYFFVTLTKGNDKFLDMIQTRAPVWDPSESVNNKFRQALSKENPKCDPEILQELAWEVEMSGEEESAVQILMEKLPDIKHQQPGEEAQKHMQLLVQLLIYQEKYCHAKELCKSLIDMNSRDPKPYLYLAVIYQLTGDTKNSEDMWYNFQNPRSKESLLGSLTSNSTIPFTYFKNLIEELWKEIKRG